ncbi:DUF4350 domain-containing protein [Mucilaginibacter sp. RB4R14]|uniref:DUF4350 domain-containing protein n=1 Tax=Mucilaginibacter aurantiaciroseus TaxID=2949308 RepID=UPI002091C4FE|nr:DUF4350 domain-containing protein [Mucilaginibacter aurantiaciroseus]MCO5934184.1 DUF4350 domain-containing protein [Mucilaginibacter aurantiaciroseus]
MKRKLFVVTLFVYSIVTIKVMGQTVTLDHHFNRETCTNKAGQPERFHYLWEDTANTGFSKWGEIFKLQGAILSTLEVAPTAVNLKGIVVYIIVDPDSKKENPLPNYITKADAENIAQWVKAGGKLVLMANDSANVELPNFNILAGKFGLHFNNDMQNHVVDDAHFEDGATLIRHNFVFKTARKVFMKDVCSIALTGSAKSILKSANGSTIAAIVRYGKGTIFAVGDPWLYNEYVNGRLPAGFDNDKAAIELTTFLLSHKKLNQ